MYKSNKEKVKDKIEGFLVSYKTELLAKFPEEISIDYDKLVYSIALDCNCSVEAVEKIFNLYFQNKTLTKETIISLNYADRKKIQDEAVEMRKKTIQINKEIDDELKGVLGE